MSCVKTSSKYIIQQLARSSLDFPMRSKKSDTFSHSESGADLHQLHKEKQPNAVSMYIPTFKVSPSVNYCLDKQKHHNFLQISALLCCTEDQSRENPNALSTLIYIWRKKKQKHRQKGSTDSNEKFAAI